MVDQRSDYRRIFLQTTNLRGEPVNWWISIWFFAYNQDKKATTRMRNGIKQQQCILRSEANTKNTSTGFMRTFIYGCDVMNGKGMD